MNISPPEIGLWRAPMFVPVTTLGQYKTTNFNGFPTKEKDFFLSCQVVRGLEIVSRLLTFQYKTNIL